MLGAGEGPGGQRGRLHKARDSVSAEASADATTVCRKQGVFCTDQGWDAGGRGPWIQPCVPRSQGLSSCWPRGADACSTLAVGGEPTFSLPRTLPAVGACAQTRGGHRAPGPRRPACRQAQVLQTHLGGQGEAGSAGEGSADHIAMASPAPLSQTLPGSVLRAVRSLLSRSIHRDGCLGPCWTSPLGGA